MRSHPERNKTRLKSEDDEDDQQEVSEEPPEPGLRRLVRPARSARLGPKPGDKKKNNKHALKQREMKKRLALERQKLQPSNFQKVS